MRAKDLAKYIYHYSGLERHMFRLLRNSKGPLLLIIVYHRVCPSLDSYEYMGVPVEAFDAHMRFIKNHFQVVSMPDGLDFLYGGKGRGIYVSINLDDGYRDNYVYAFPVIKKYSIPAALFVATDLVGREYLFWWDEVFQIIRSSGRTCRGIKQGNIIRDGYRAARINSFLMDKNEPEIRQFVDRLKSQSRVSGAMTPSRMLGWEEMKEMALSGISFGSHTKGHGNMCLMDDNEMHRDIMGSKLELEKRLGQKQTGFCYPFGIYDERVKDIVRGAGFAYARTCIRGSNRKDTCRFSLRCIDASFSLNKSLFTSALSFYSLRH